MMRALKSSVLASTLLLVGCSDAHDNHASVGGTAAVSGGSAGAASGAGTGGTNANAGAGGAITPAEPSWESCQDSDSAFVKKAYLATLGRRPRGQAEIDFYTDLISRADKLTDPVAHGLSSGRKLAVRAMIKANPLAYLRRWADFYRDALRVQRDRDATCYQSEVSDDAKAVAKHVRGATARVSGPGPFTMLDLIRGSLELDDVSPMYVGNLFAMMNSTFDGANAERVQLELARRQNFGAWFSASYLHRDMVCLKCHNSEASTTFDPDPAKNRHFPLRALLEKSLFGASTGPEKVGDYEGATRAFGALRYDGFVMVGADTQPPVSGAAGAGAAEEPPGDDPKRALPWGWADTCGSFIANPGEDVAHVDTRFGSVSGTSASMWELSRALQRGMSSIAQHGLTRGPRGEVPEPDEAFAYLVSMQVVEQVWRETVGTPLTIANYFPRNADQRDQLYSLTEGFVGSRFSNLQLLLSIFGTPLFNLKAPDAGCIAPYSMPPLFDPWVTSDDDAARRGNSLGDGVFALSSRVAVSAAAQALAWPPLRTGPGASEAEIGFFISNAQPGFRGFDFQARLAWEDRVANCRNPGSTPDFVDELLEQAKHAPQATLADAVVALKDRLLNDPRLTSVEERAALGEVTGMALDKRLSGVDQAAAATALRRACSALLASPQFLLAPIVAPDGGKQPSLAPKSASYSSICQEVAAHGPVSGFKLTCDSQGFTLEKTVQGASP